MERRAYERIKVEARGTFFIINDDACVAEFVGNIVDISEAGIKVMVEPDKYEEALEMVSEGSQISFQAVDNFVLYGSDITELFSGKVFVVRKEADRNGIFLGCKIRPLTQTLQKYIDDKKISVFIEKMHTDK